MKERCSSRQLVGAFDSLFTKVVASITAFTLALGLCPMPAYAASDDGAAVDSAGKLVGAAFTVDLAQEDDEGGDEYADSDGKADRDFGQGFVWMGLEGGEEGFIADGVTDFGTRLQLWCYDSDTWEDVCLQEGIDYQLRVFKVGTDEEGEEFLTESSAQAAGEYRAVFTGLGDWAGIYESDFYVYSATDLRFARIAMDHYVYYESVEPYLPGFDVFLRGERLIRNEDYTIELIDDEGDVVEGISEAGDYDLVVTGKGSYEGRHEIAVYVESASYNGVERVDLERADVYGVFERAAGTDSDYGYGRSIEACFPDLEVWLDGRLLSSDDYGLYVKTDRGYEDYVPNEPGTYELVIAAAYSPYRGDCSIEFEVVEGKRNLEDAQVNVENSKLLATGDRVVPVYWLSCYDGQTYESVGLKEGVDYTTSIVQGKWDTADEFGAVEPGKYYLRFDSCDEGDYVGTVFREFTLHTSNDLARATIDFGKDNAWWYDSSKLTEGEELYPQPTVHLDGKVIDPESYAIEFYDNYWDCYYDENKQNAKSSVPGRGYYYVKVTGRAADGADEGYFGSVAGYLKVNDMRFLGDGYLSLNRYSYSISGGEFPSGTVWLNDRKVSSDAYGLHLYRWSEFGGDEADGGYVEVDGFDEVGEYRVEATALEGSGYIGVVSAYCYATNGKILSDLNYSYNSTEFLASGSPIPFDVTFWKQGYDYYYDDEDGDEHDSGKLILGTDYEIMFKDSNGAEIDRPSEPGEYEAVAMGIGEYSGSVSWSISVYSAGDIASAFSDRYSDQTSAVYTGTGDVPGIRLRSLDEYGNRGDSLRIGVDFAIDHYEAVDGQLYEGDLKDMSAGTYYAVVKGLGDYENSEVRARFTVRDSNDLSNAYVKGILGETLCSPGAYYWWNESAYVYTGKPINPVRSVVLNGIPLLHGADYGIEYYRDGQQVESAVEPGVYYIRLVPGSNEAYVNNGVDSYRYQGCFEIRSNDEKDLGSALVGMKSSYYYYGEPVSVEPKVLYRGKPLVEHEDYEVVFESADGDYDVVENGQFTPGREYRATIIPAEGSGFTGSRDRWFQVEDCTDLSRAEVSQVAASTLQIADVQDVTVPLLKVETAYGNGKELVEGEDYELEYAALTASDDDDYYYYYYDSEYVEELDFQAGRPQSTGRWLVRARGLEPLKGTTRPMVFNVVDLKNIASSSLAASGALGFYDGKRQLDVWTYNSFMHVTGLAQADGLWPYGTSYAYVATLKEGVDYSFDKSEGKYKIYDKDHNVVELEDLAVDSTYYVHAQAVAGSGYIGEKWVEFTVWNWYDDGGAGSSSSTVPSRSLAVDGAEPADDVDVADEAEIEEDDGDYDGYYDEGGQGLRVDLEKRTTGYTGEGIDPGLVVNYDGVVLDRDGDDPGYVLSFYEYENYYSYSKTNPVQGLPWRIGSYIVYVVAKVEGADDIAAIREFNIVNPYDLDNAVIEGVGSWYGDREEVAALSPVVKRADGVELEEGVDYELRLSFDDSDYNTWRDVSEVSAEGEYRFTVYGLGDYAGRGVNHYFRFAQDGYGGLSIDDADVDFSSVPSFTDAWFSVHPRVTIGDVELIEGVDYYSKLYYGEFSGVNVVTGPGEYELDIIGMGKYDGYKEVYFDVADGNAKVLSLDDATVTGITKSVAFAGKAITPDPKVTLGGATLIKGVDYEVSYKNNKKVGTATVTIAALGEEYTGSIEKTFTITKGSLASAVISEVTNAKRTYSGNAFKPVPTVKLKNGVTLTSGTDYTVSYKNNTKAGTATVTVTGMGNYKDSTSANFTIERKSLAKGSVTGVKNVTYDGKQKKLTSLAVKLGSTKLKSGTDYKVTYKSNVNAGKATAFIEGKGNYSGKITKTFTIKRASLAKASITVKDQRYNKGQAIKPTPKVKLGSKSLKLNRDYTVSYKNNKKKGKATLTIKGKGNYSGSASKKFVIK